MANNFVTTNPKDNMYAGNIAGLQPQIRYGSTGNVVPSGSVLGATTGGSSSGKQNGGWYNGEQYWENGKNPNDNKGSGDGGGGGGGGNNYDAEIESLYKGAMDVANDSERSVNLGADEDTASIESRYANDIKNTDTEATNLTADADMNQSAFEKTLRSALSEAVRAYNALQQQTSARFGRGGSAGQAVGELAQQEFFRQQGKVEDRSAEGAMKFGVEKTRIGQYIAQKKDELDLNKKDALTQIKSNLRAQLAEIAARKNDIEANKTRDKMQVLQANMSMAKQVEAADKQVRQSLALAAIQQFQETTGQKFTPKEIVAYFEDIVNGSSISGSSPTIARTNANYGVKNTDDELQSLT